MRSLRSLCHPFQGFLNGDHVAFGVTYFSSAQELGKVPNWRILERFAFLGLSASWPILRNDALR
jgi:hypothetical protein